MTTLSYKNLPEHIGIIMDGNGRWAQKRCLPRSLGHKQGLQTVKNILAKLSKLGVGYVSLFTFSTENWKRDEQEVSFLMNLITKHLRGEFDFYREHQIRVVHSGRKLGLPAAVMFELEQVCNDTAHFKGLTVNLAINYGGRDEIVRGVQSYVTGLLKQGTDITDLLKSLATMKEADFCPCLDTPDLPDLDLIIRSGGEKRISNFLLWKSAYAELYFSETLWPDWTEKDLHCVLSDFDLRTRRFGGTLSTSA